MKRLKDKKVVLYRMTTIKDSAGFATKKYTPIHTGSLWAYVRQLSASEFYAARAVQQTEEMLFAINRRRDLDADCFIRYKGFFYDVNRVDTFEGYKQDLKLYAARLQSQPKLGDIADYQGYFLIVFCFCG